MVPVGKWNGISLHRFWAPCLLGRARSIDHVRALSPRNRPRHLFPFRPFILALVWRDEVRPIWALKQDSRDNPS
jgi:hypothetical protein